MAEHTLEQLMGASERLDLWRGRMSKMNSYRDHYSRRWDDYERSWKMFLAERSGEDSWRANLPETWSFATIKTAQSAFVDSRVEPILVRHEETDRIKAEDMGDLYQDISEKGEMDDELYLYRLDAFKYGIGWLKTTYVEDRRTVNAIKSFDSDTGKIVYETQDIKDFDDPKSQRISPWLMFVDEMARFNINTVRYMTEIEILGKDDAKRIYGHLIDDFDTAVKDAGELKQFLSAVKGEQVAQTADTNTSETQDVIRFFAPFELEAEHVVLWHCWDKVNDTMEIFANGTPLQEKTDTDPSPIPYVHKQLPYTPLRYSPYGGDEFYAAGIIEIGRVDAAAITSYREMMSDRQKLSLFSPAFTDSEDEIDQRSLIMKPLSIIPTRGGVPTQWQIPGINNSDLALLNELQESFKRGVGVDERVLGTSVQGATLTATEISFLREAALRRLREFAFIYKGALKREVKLKISLFKQYFSSPISREEHVKGDEAVKEIFKTFRVKTGNTYKQKTVTEDLFNEEFDIDINMRVLIPMTRAQMITKWSQLIRDTVPFASALSVDVDKLYDKLYDAFEENLDAFRIDDESDALEAAESEHRLLADENTTDAAIEELRNGTPFEFLNAAHIKRHRTLLRGDVNISEKAMQNIALHIAKDVDNLREKVQKEAQSPSVQQIGGISPTAPTQQTQPPQLPPQTNQAEGLTL